MQQQLLVHMKYILLHNGGIALLDVSLAYLTQSLGGMHEMRFNAEINPLTLANSGLKAGVALNRTPVWNGPRCREL